MPAIATATLVKLGAAATLKITQAAIGAVKQATVDAAKSVVGYIQSGEYVTPVVAEAMLSKLNTQSLIEACNQDIKRKGSPKRGDAYKRRGNATASVVDKLAISVGAPEYERLRLKARIYRRFANSAKAASLDNDAEYAKLDYTPPAAPSGTSGGGVSTSPEDTKRMLAVGAVGALVLWMLMRGSS